MFWLKANSLAKFENLASVIILRGRHIKWMAGTFRELEMSSTFRDAALLLERNLYSTVRVNLVCQSAIDYSLFSGFEEKTCRLQFSCSVKTATSGRSQKLCTFGYYLLLFQFCITGNGVVLVSFKWLIQYLGQGTSRCLAMLSTCTSIEMVCVSF